MAHIDVLAYDSEDNRSRMRTKLMDKVKEEIQAFEGHVTAHSETFEAFIYYLGSNNFIFHLDIVVANVYILVMEDTTSAHPSSYDYIPTSLP